MKFAAVMKLGLQTIERPTERPTDRPTDGEPSAQSPHLLYLPPSYLTDQPASQHALTVSWADGGVPIHALVILMSNEPSN